MFRKRHPITRKIFQVLLETGFENCHILQIVCEDSTLKVTLHLSPYHELEDLESIFENLKQELQAFDVKIHKQTGKTVEIHFGMNNLTKIKWNPSCIHQNTLKIELPSAYGSCFLDFSDGASCHLLNGGTTRMGKTSFLLYLSTMLYIQNPNKIALHITSTKLKDFYPFANCSNCSLSRTEGELLETLDTLITEYQHRDQLLYSPNLEKATDAKSVLQHYPDKYENFLPIFLIIDEYARFSDNKEIQKKVMELVETAGYVNIHIIISTQRPDARSVLHPRIKSNLLARICFTTADQNNSIVILDREGAEKLGKIPGRAIYLDGDFNIIQVPELTPEKAYELLTPYRKEEKPHEQETARPTHHDVSAKIQNLFQKSASDLNLFPELQPDQRNESSHEATGSGWFRLASEKGKR